MGYVFNPFTGNFDVAGGAASIPDPLTVNNLTVNNLLTANHIHGDIAGSLYIHVKNTSGVTLAKGTPVYAVGAVGDTTTLEVAAADAADINKTPAIGILREELIQNASGHAVMFGELTGFNTGSYQINDELFLAAGGGLTATKPTTGYIQGLAVVGRVHANTGTILVWTAGRVQEAGGSNTQIQFNDGGNLGGDADLTYNKTTNLLTTKGDINLDDGGSFTTTLQTITPTANRVISFPDSTGTVALVAGSSGQLLWNNAGVNAGASTLTYDGSILTTSGRFINSYNAAASAPAKLFSGTWFTGGTATTTKPHVLIEPTGTTSTAWSTSGTGLGVNAPSGFAGRIVDLQLNGSSRFVVGTNFIALQNPDSTTTGGNARGTNAVDFSSGRTNAINVASGADSFLAATSNGRATGTRSASFNNSVASGSEAFAICGGEAAGANAFAHGFLSFANGVNSVAIGSSVIASAQQAIAIGVSATASGIRSVAVNWGANATNQGQFSYGYRMYSAQWNSLGLVNATTSSSAVELFIEGPDNGTTRAVIPANTTWAGTATILARTRNGISNAHFQRQVMIKRDGSNNTTLVGSVQTLGTDIKSNADFDATVTITADDINESLKVEGTARVGGTVSSITSSGTTCTVTTSANHGILTGEYVTIAGATETAYNGTFVITKTGNTTFTYTAASTPSASPATGTPTANITCRWVCKLDLIQIAHSA